MALADHADVVLQALLAGLGQVVRQQQDPVGPGALGGLDQVDRDRGAVAGRRDDRQLVGGLFHGRGDDLLDLLQVQGEELSGAAGGEQTRGLVLTEPGDVVAVGRLVELQVGGEVGDRERQQTGAEALGDFLRGVSGHDG